LRERNYRLFAISSLVANNGIWMQRVAQDWLILLLTGSAAALGIATGLQFLPMLLVSPFAGLIADRYKKRTVLIVTQAAIGTSAVALGLVTVFGEVTVWHVYAAALLFGIGTAFDRPTRESLVNEIVERDALVNALGLNSASLNIGRMVGPAIAGGLIALFGSGVTDTGYVILINGGGYLIVIAALVMLRNPNGPVSMVPKAPGQLREGFRYVRSRPDLQLVLVVIFAFGTFGMNFHLTTALMATQVYGKGAAGFGLLGTILAIGSLTGSLLAARRRTSSLRIVVIAAMLFGAVEIFVGLMPSYIMFALFLPLCGLGSMTTSVSASTYVQMHTEPFVRGRVMSLYLACFMGGTPIGAPMLGLVAQEFGARWTLIGGGAVTAGTTAVAATWYSRRTAGARFDTSIPLVSTSGPSGGPAVASDDVL
jgi:MFS family permease